jgi:hypothetical protein
VRIGTGLAGDIGTRGYAAAEQRIPA